MKHTIDLLAHMHQGAIVVTPNNRLAHQLLQAFSWRYQSQENTPLVKPNCLPYQNFLHYLYQQLEHKQSHLTHPMVLNKHQQRFLWRKVFHLSKTDITEELLNLIEDAWSDCQSWQCNLDDKRFAYAPQTQRFQTWSQAFLQALDEMSALTLDQIPAYLIQQPLACNPTTVIWTCFDDFTPMQLALQTYLQAQGCPQVYDDIRPQSIHGHQFAAADECDEYQQMMAWTQARLAEGDQHIALIIPDLAAKAEDIQRLFNQCLPDVSYNLSLAKPLNHMPIISTALQWLQLTPLTGTLSQHQVNLLLQSPFIIASQHEHAERSEMLQKSSFMKEHSIDWTLFLEHLNNQSPQLYQRLQSLSPYPDSASPHAWISYFKARLDNLGFPGDYSLDSTNYQYLQRFLQLLDELISLTAVAASITQQEAFDALTGACLSTVFQVKKPAGRVIVLGLLEGSGCEFDSIWLSGLSDQCLPQKNRFSPFIPISIQKDLQFPHTSPAKEIQWAQHTLQRFAYACQQIIYSYPKWVQDIPQRPCVFIQSYPLADFSMSAPVSTTSKLVRFDECYQLPIGQDETLSGGTGFLASQAKCPFQALAAYRLHADPSPDISEGPDVLERGQLIHKIMETLWRTLGNQATLLTLSASALEQLVDASIEAALSTCVRARPHSFPSIVRQVEKQRLKQLVYASFVWEKQRPPFSIESLEQQYTLTLADLSFKIRIDRIDAVFFEGEPQKIVIDYKTSLPAQQPWFDERPEAPQLLIYALLDPTITTLLFLQLKAGAVTPNGLTHHQAMLPQITALDASEHWSDYQHRWQQQLIQLASEIKSGQCVPTPHRSSHCHQCAFPSLCRIE